MNLGWIDATGHRLGKVSVDGDLAKITAGTGTGAALKSLTAHSLGALGGTTWPDLVSSLDGSAGRIVILGDVVDARLDVSGDVGTLSVKGSVIGQANFSGNISITGSANVVNIGGSIVGGAGAFSGVVSPRKPGRSRSAGR